MATKSGRSGGKGGKSKGGKVRSAKTGRYVKKSEAKRNPGGTVTEHDKK
jgi:hypothetical protein